MLRIKADIQRVKKLINIARPIELPPLKSDDIKSDGSQTKKKFELPLFGKKKTFGFDRLKQQQQTANAKQVKLSEQNKVDEIGSIEEFDEDENDTKPAKQPAENASKETAKESPIVEVSKVATSCDEEIKESTRATAREEPETKERQIIDEKKSSTHNIISDIDHHKAPPATATEVAIEKNNEEPQPVATTKSKNKNRNRNKARHQIDIDDTEEDTSPQKYSGWVPPSNQSGDGITDLNSKYGY